MLTIEESNESLTIVYTFAYRFIIFSSTCRMHYLSRSLSYSLSYTLSVFRRSLVQSVWSSAQSQSKYNNQPIEHHSTWPESAASRRKLRAITVCADYDYRKLIREK